MINKNKKAFTLVELIITIIILAILATISFINFNSYTKESENTKTEVNLQSINKKISVIVAANNKIYLKDLLKTPKIQNQLDNSLTFASGTNINVWVNYNAWELSFVNIWENINDYKDAEWNSYIYAYVYDLEKWKYFWQISGITVNNIWKKIAKLEWYYYKIDTVNDVSGLIKAIDWNIVENNSETSLAY